MTALEWADGVYREVGVWHAGETVRLDEPVPVSFEVAGLTG